MTHKTEPTKTMTYQSAISILGEAGVFTADDRFRDGHTAASFAGSSIDITGSSLTRRAVTDKDWMQFFGHLLAVAADRGLRPAELLGLEWRPACKVPTSRNRADLAGARAGGVDLRACRPR